MMQGGQIILYNIAQLTWKIISVSCEFDGFSWRGGVSDLSAKEHEDVPSGLTCQEIYRPCGIKLAVNL